MNRFEKIKDEFILFLKRIELSFFEMENEWINGVFFVLGGDLYSLLFLIVLVFVFIVLFFIVFGLGYSVVVVVVWGLGNIFLNIGIILFFEIKNVYENCKKLVCKELCFYFEKKYGLIISKMIDKIIGDIIFKCIDLLMMLIG